MPSINLAMQMLLKTTEEDEKAAALHKDQHGWCSNTSFIRTGRHF